MKYISIAELESVREIQLVFAFGAVIRFYNKYCNNYNELKQLQQFVNNKVQNSKNQYVIEWYTKLNNQLNKFTLQQ